MQWGGRLQGEIGAGDEMRVGEVMRESSVKRRAQHEADPGLYLKGISSICNRTF